MSSLFRVGIVSFLVAGTVACGIADAVNDAAEDAKVAAAKAALGDKGFAIGITAVTSAAFEAMGDSLKEEGAGAPRNYTPAAESQTFTVDAKANVNGGKVTVKGTIVMTPVGDKGGSIESDLTATFTDMTVVIEGKSYKSSGTQTIKGNVTFADEGKVDATLKLTGNFTLGADKFVFDIDYKITDKTYSYTGTVNGDAVTGSGTMPEGDQGQQQQVNKSCTYVPDLCKDYVGSNASNEDTACATSGTPSQNDTCSTMNLVGSCTVSSGSSSEYVVRYFSPTYNNISSEGACTALSGTFTLPM